MLAVVSHEMINLFISAIVFGTVAFGIATGSFIPFTTIVNIVYSVLGLSGVILSVFLLVKIIRVRRSGAAEAG